MTLGQLIAHALLNQTMVIVGSDHGFKSSTTDRIPWIIRFPNGQYAGRVTTSVQNLDIAPTVLDYLDLDIPEWMQGQSVLDEKLAQRTRDDDPPYRYLSSTGEDYPVTKQ